MFMMMKKATMNTSLSYFHLGIDSEDWMLVTGSFKQTHMYPR